MNKNATLHRRGVLQIAAVFGAMSALSPVKLSLAQSARARTPDQILGPFYPAGKTPDLAGDLTHLPGRAGRAEGQLLNVTGRVLNIKGEPVRGARLEVWQANANGRYTHPADTNPAPLDANFEGFAVLKSDEAEGRYKGEAVGTIWVVAHDTSRRFDAEDLRVLTSLAAFAEAAYQAWLAVNATQRIAAIVDSSDDAIVSKDLNGTIATWNTGAERIFGYVAEEVVGKPITILIPAERRQEEDEILDHIRHGERVEHFETVRIRKDGSSVDISLTVSPVRNSAGKIIGASKIARDITERKHSEKHVASLAREAEHRAKNMLAIVQATVRLTEADTPKELKRAIEGRIQALANVHELFVQSRWAGAELRNLVTQELSPYCRDGQTRARIEGPNLLLAPNTAQTMAVALHELATNAAKYGALSGPNGKIHVDWSRVADGRIVLRWTETDGPTVTPPTRKGFGMRVIESMIQQDKGDFRLDWRVEGLMCEITMPP